MYAFLMEREIHKWISLNLKRRNLIKGTVDIALLNLLQVVYILLWELLDHNKSTE